MNTWKWSHRGKAAPDIKGLAHFNSRLPQNGEVEKSRLFLSSESLPIKLAA
ncbi:MAG TPA: hypothetical protein V6D12_15240 [Candidatus Obscuribacterales bacterium]